MTPHADETTLRWMEAAAKLGHRTLWAEARQISWDSATGLTIQGKEFNYDQISKLRTNLPTYDFLDSIPFQTIKASDFDTYFYRLDPPMNPAYTLPLKLLHLGAPQATGWNDATLILSSSEKLEITRLAQKLAPEQTGEILISSQLSELKIFLGKHPQSVVKPLEGAKALGVERILGTESESQITEILKQASHDFQIPVLVQPFQSAIFQGETRLWFAAGNFLAAMRRLIPEGEFRPHVDIYQVELKALSSRELEIAAQINRYLNERKIGYAAVDLIGNVVTDFNFTSPGLFVELERLTGQNLAEPFLKKLLA